MHCRQAAGKFQYKYAPRLLTRKGKIARGYVWDANARKFRIRLQLEVPFLHLLTCSLHTQSPSELLACAIPNGLLSSRASSMFAGLDLLLRRPLVKSAEELC